MPLWGSNSMTSWGGVHLLSGHLSRVYPICRATPFKIPERAIKPLVRHITLVIYSIVIHCFLISCFVNMVSLRIIHGMKTRSKQPKPVTLRQRELLAQQAKELEQAEKANARLQKRLADLEKRLAERARFHPPPQGYNGPFELPNYHDRPDPLDDPAGAEDEDENIYVIDPNAFMPRQQANQPEDPVLASLRRDQHLDNRLIHEERWAWQYAIMVPTFLRCRLLTSNWGNYTNWNTDFRAACHCPSQTEREVDLVDVLSQLIYLPTLKEVKLKNVFVFFR